MASNAGLSDPQACPLGVSDDRKIGTVRRLRTDHSPDDSLETRCRAMVVAHLERYPPEAYGILSEEAWNAIVHLRHEKTTPNTGKGGLDGTGRVAPAIPDRFLLAVEQSNPHLSESTVADRLVWRDCVEYRFKIGGLTRPPTLMYPWPILVERVQRAGNELLALLKAENPSEKEQHALETCIKIISDTPMNVSLLQASGVGKSLKKFVKMCSKNSSCLLDVRTERPHGTARDCAYLSPLAHVEQILDRWKNMAANSGVAINSKPLSQGSSDECVNDEDIRLVETCQTWRDLFGALQQREAQRRANQGARMREIRNNLATGRPKVVKVHTSNSRHDKILDRPHQKKAQASSTAASSGSSAMERLRKESAVVASRQKSSANAPIKKSAGFGAAVAFASSGKKVCPPKQRSGQTKLLDGGKQMKVPAKTTRDSLMSKFKKRGPDRR